MRIPFDSLTLAAVASELQEYVGAKVQGITQPDEVNVAFDLYSLGKEAHFLFCCHPNFARCHFITRKVRNTPQPLQFCTILRTHLTGSWIKSVEQVNFDRVLRVEFARPDGDCVLVAELMGKHSNLILIDKRGTILGAAKWVGKSKSKRPIQPNQRYEKPPFPEKPPLLDAKAGEDFKQYTGASPFLIDLINRSAGALNPSKIRQIVEESSYAPVICPGIGAYPLSVAAMVVEEFPRQTISIALEQHYVQAMLEHEANTLRASLLGQLNRVALARDVALKGLDEAKDAAARAREVQMKGELLLAYQNQVPEGASLFETVDYEGEPLTIRLNQELNVIENANKYFDKAKHAKERKDVVLDQIQRLTADRTELIDLISKVEKEEKVIELRKLQELAQQKKWLHLQLSSGKKKEERPYEGHRIRELMGPGGLTMLYGENAESNDYLTLRVAKPNDYWLHVRGGVSAHVIIVTNNKPDKIGKEALEFAAKVAVQNSPSKHSGYVPVDYTLKKYVRKPRGAPKGTAIYTHEKTLHVEN